MELFKLRYNLYKYLIKDDFNFKNTIELFNVFKNFTYIIITFFILIFIIGYEYLNIFIIFFIIILLMFAYYIEIILIKLDEIIKNKYFKNYCNYYTTLNKIFNINYDNINDIDSIKNNPEASSVVDKIEMTYGGRGYQSNKVYLITIIGNINATANIRSSSDGTLNGEIYNLSKGEGISPETKPIITLLPTTPIIDYKFQSLIPIINYMNNQLSLTNNIYITPIAEAQFKIYVSSNHISMSNIKEYSLSFMNVYNNIKRNIGYIEDVLTEDIEDRINLIKKENDLLRYIDIYDKRYQILNKFLVINKEKNGNLFNIFPVNNTDYKENINDTTYLINLENFEKYKDNYKNIYSKFINELALNLNNSNNDDKIFKSIAEFNYVFYQLLAMIIIILTIIFHIFYIKLY